jgi:endoglycosylceramidase
LRRRVGVRAVVLAALVGLALSGCSFVTSPGRPRVPLGRSGRWFTDRDGRVVMPRGVNFVEKWAPYTPEAAGFDDDDAALIAANGFNTVRLGVVFGFLMPEPGRIDQAYLDSIVRTVGVLARHGLYVLLDFHQDGYGPAVHGNGMPEWSTLTDGLDNPQLPFPVYYFGDPALQRAFENFWADKPGPDGVPLQQHYAEGMQAVARRVALSPNVLGYEAMNEPWPGADWGPCIDGCADYEQQLLGPFDARMTEAVRTVDPFHPVYVEPFSLFNVGNAQTRLPGRGSPNVLATHVYGLDTTGEANAKAMDATVAAAERDGAPAIVTEWGAVNDPVELDRTQNQLDSHLLPGIFWSYNGHVTTDSHQPLVPPNVNATVLDVLSRPYPSIVNGTPESLAYRETTHTLDLVFSTRRPDGRTASPRAGTAIMVPERAYPGGYAVTATGADVTSAPCAPTLTLRNHPHASTVTVHVAPGTCR